MVAAVKRLICRLDRSGEADTPGQRATLRNTRPDCGPRGLRGRLQEEGHHGCVIREGRHLDAGDMIERDEC